jgi:uncharacterized membrane protein YkoI
MMASRSQSMDEETHMRTKTKVLIATGAALVIAAAAATVSVATGSDDQPLEGSDLDRATAAALAHTGGGTVVDSELGDDGASYEVEVRLDDGSVIEVQLDDRFQVAGSTPDDDVREAGRDD